MLLKKDTNNTTTVALFESSNIMQTIFYEDKNALFVFFYKGTVYSYFPIKKEMYEEFEKSDSQGEFFIDNIKKNPNIKYRKEFVLNEFEIKDIKVKIEEMKKNKEIL